MAARAFEWRWEVLDPYYGAFGKGLIVTAQLSGITRLRPASLAS